MGMILGLTTVSDENIQRILDDPPLLCKLLAPDDPEWYERAREEVGGPDAELILGEGEGDSIDLDKAWHGLHFLLTSTAWEGEPPLDLLVAGGTPLDEIEDGYGPPRLIGAREVAAAHRALSGLSDEVLRARFDPRAMTAADIYPAIWDRDPGEDDALGYLMENLHVLRDGLARASAAGLGVVVSIQ
jgi:hypothetical protein